MKTLLQLHRCVFRLDSLSLCCRGLLSARHNVCGPSDIPNPKP